MQRIIKPSSWLSLRQRPLSTSNAKKKILLRPRLRTGARCETLQYYTGARVAVAHTQEPYLQDDPVLLLSYLTVLLYGFVSFKILCIFLGSNQ